MSAHLKAASRARFLGLVLAVAGLVSLSAVVPEPPKREGKKQNPLARAARALGAADVLPAPDKNAAANITAAEDVAREARAALEELDAWTRETEQLLDSPRGAMLTRRFELAERAYALTRTPRPRAAELKALLLAAERARDANTQSLQGESVAGDRHYSVARALEALTAARAARAAYSAARAELRSLLEEAEALPSTGHEETLRARFQLLDKRY